MQSRHTKMHIKNFKDLKKMFAKFGCPTRTFRNKKEEKTVSLDLVRQTLLKILEILSGIKFNEKVHIAI